MKTLNPFSDLTVDDLDDAFLSATPDYATTRLKIKKEDAIRDLDNFIKLFSSLFRATVAQRIIDLELDDNSTSLDEIFSSQDQYLTEFQQSFKSHQQAIESAQDFAALSSAQSTKDSYVASVAKDSGRALVSVLMKLEPIELS